MKVLHVTDSAALSGAGIAASRLVAALREAGVEATLAVARGDTTGDWVEPLHGPAGRALHTLRRACSKVVLRASDPGVRETLSGNFWPTGTHRTLNRAEADIVHLHWIGAETIRIEEVAAIRRPLVWTMHDEWWARGLEHYEGDAREKRSRLFRQVDAAVYRRKFAAWTRKPMHIVCPSRWLADRVLARFPMDSTRVHVVRNAVPTDVFAPGARQVARERLGFESDATVIGVGALNARDDPRKGFNHLREAFGHVADRRVQPAPRVLLFGAGAGGELQLPTRYVGTVSDQRDLPGLYAAMDIFVCPSRQENLPNTIAEALSCGVPAVAFDVGGIPDLVRHRRTGYLARPFDSADLAHGILECLESSRNRELGVAARAFAVRELDGSAIAARHRTVYDRALEHAAAEATPV